MNDMSQVIIPKSDQWNADDFLSGPLTFTITDVQIRGGQEQPVSIYMQGTEKAFRPCKSMSRVLVAIWGADARQYIGRSLTLYRDPTVKWGGMEVGGIRISHMSDMEKPHTMALTATKGSRKPYTVKPLTSVPTGKIDKAAEGVRTLIARIGSVEAGNIANVIDDPVVVKQRAWLSANRPDLAAEVDAAIEAKRPAIDDDDPFGLPPIPTEGPADSQRGEEHSATAEEEADADKLIGFIATKVTQIDLNSLMADWKDKMLDWSPETRGRVAEAQQARVEAIRGEAG